MSRSGGYKCYNIHCGSCIGKTLCGEPGDSAIGCNNRIVPQKTNADRIRAMSDEELATFIVDKSPSMFSCNGRCLYWLRQPAEEDREKFYSKEE